MFKIDNVILDFKTQITHRDLGYGRDDLGDKARSFLWVEPLEEFILKCEYSINDFVNDYKMDDEDNVPIDERDYLFDLNYPSAQDFLYQYPEQFCKLLIDYQDLLINRPYIDLPYFAKNKPFVFHGFAINNIDEIIIQGDKINMQGVGYYF